MITLLLKTRYVSCYKRPIWVLWLSFAPLQSYDLFCFLWYTVLFLNPRTLHMQFLLLRRFLDDRNMCPIVLMREKNRCSHFWVQFIGICKNLKFAYFLTPNPFLHSSLTETFTHMQTDVCTRKFMEVFITMGKFGFV